MDTEELQLELEKCKESPAYFYNKYCELRDKEGNIIPKKDVTDEEIEAAVMDYKSAKEFAEHLYERSHDKFYLLWRETFDDTFKASMNKTIASGLEKLAKSIEESLVKNNYLPDIKDLKT